MPDIRIERKEKNNNIWPWLLGLLALLLVAWLVIGNLGDDDVEEVAVADDVEVVEEAPSRSSEIVESGDTYTLLDPRDTQQLNANYTTYIDDYKAYTTTLTGDMGLDHEFSHNALVQLANATAALASVRGLSGDTSILAKEEFIKGKADAITRDPEATTHGDDIRAASVAISEMIARIQEESYPGLEGAVSDLKDEAEAIKPSDLTLDQKEDIRSFFGSASVTLDAMQDYDKQNNRG